jgi:hypothetical protein
MKKLIIIKPDPEDEKNGDVLAGNYYNGTLYLNIEYAWDKTKSFNKFVNYLSKVWEHETLHYLVDKELHRKQYRGFKPKYLDEDVILRKLTGEHLTKRQRRFYTKQDMRNN